MGHKKGFETEKNFYKNSPLRLSYGSYTLQPSPKCHVPMVIICYNEPTTGTRLLVRPVSEPSIGRRHVGCVFVMFVVVRAWAGTSFFFKNFRSGGTHLYCMIAPAAARITSTVGYSISLHERCRRRIVGSMPYAPDFATGGSWRSQIAAFAAAFFARASLTSEVVSQARFSLKGLSAEMSAAVGFMAEKSEIEHIFWGNARSELSVLVTACWMTCLNTNFILFLNCRIFQ